MVMPAMSDAKASQTMPWPGSALAMSRVYSLKPVQLDRQVRARSTRSVSPTWSATGRKFSGMGMPSAFGADDPIGQDEDAAHAVVVAVEQQLQPEVAAGDGQDPVGQARRRVGQRDRRVPQRLARGVADDEVRRRPEPVLVERVAADRQRVVDPDRLARDLLAVPVDGEVGREVGRHARSRIPAHRSRGS